MWCHESVENCKIYTPTTHHLPTPPPPPPPYLKSIPKPWTYLSYRASFIKNTSISILHISIWLRIMYVYTSPCYCCRGVFMMTSLNRSLPVHSPYKSKWRTSLMFSLICAWTNGWASKQSIRRWFETPSHSLWRHCYDLQLWKCIGKGGIGFVIRLIPIE